MLTACLWKFGVAPTSPDPLWHPDGLSLFDASSALLPDPISKKSIPVKVSRYLGNVLASVAGFCNALCQVTLLLLPGIPQLGASEQMMCRPFWFEYDCVVFIPNGALQVWREMYHKNHILHHRNIFTLLLHHGEVQLAIIL